MQDSLGADLQVGDLVLAAVTDYRGNYITLGQVRVVFGNTRGTVMVRLLHLYEAPVGMYSKDLRLYSTAYRSTPLQYLREMFPNQEVAS